MKYIVEVKYTNPAHEHVSLRRRVDTINRVVEARNENEAINRVANQQRALGFLIREAKVIQPDVLTEEINDHPAIQKFASIQHDNWRKGFDPEGTGKERVKKNSDGTEGNINVPFHKLHPDWQKENLAAGRAAHAAVQKHPNDIEKASEHVHNEWMKRNPKADYNAHQHVPYNELPEDEKEKDREHVRTMHSLLSVNENSNKESEKIRDRLRSGETYSVPKNKSLPNFSTPNRQNRKVTFGGAGGVIYSDPNTEKSEKPAKGVSALDKHGNLVGHYKDLETAKKMKPGHTYQNSQGVVKEEVEQIDELNYEYDMKRLPPKGFTVPHQLNPHLHYNPKTKEVHNTRTGTTYPDYGNEFVGYRIQKGVPGTSSKKGVQPAGVHKFPPAGVHKFPPAGVHKFPPAGVHKFPEQRMAREEVEQIDELSPFSKLGGRLFRAKQTLGMYGDVIKSVGNLVKGANAEKTDERGYVTNRNDSEVKKHFNAAKNNTDNFNRRVNAIARTVQQKNPGKAAAIRKLTANEEVEQIDEALLPKQQAVADKLKASELAANKEKAGYKFGKSLRAAKVAAKLKEETEVQYIEEKLTVADPVSAWIKDFVASDNPKFKGKSKKERIRMALGAYYAAQRDAQQETNEEAKNKYSEKEVKHDEKKQEKKKGSLNKVKMEPEMEISSQGVK